MYANSTTGKLHNLRFSRGNSIQCDGLSLHIYIHLLSPISFIVVAQYGPVCINVCLNVDYAYDVIMLTMTTNGKEICVHVIRRAFWRIGDRDAWTDLSINRSIN